MNAFVIGEIIFGLVGVFGFVSMEISMIGMGSLTILFLANGGFKNNEHLIVLVVIFVLGALFFIKSRRQEENFQHYKGSFCQKEDEIQQAMRILGLKPGFTKAELRSRRKKLAKRFHPDVGGDPDYLKRINAAYDLLKKNC